MTGQSVLARYTSSAERAADVVIASYSTSFGASTRLLGRRHRQHVRNIYALVRVADELVDGVAAEAGLSPAEQQATLTRFIEETYRALEQGYSADLVIHAFAQTARLARIDASLIDPFFASMRADIPVSSENGTDTADGVRHFTAEQHAEYVYGSAEVVGLMCLRVFMRDAKRSEAELERLEFGAKQLGAAFQNINFLRDLADDTDRLQRGYLGTEARLSDADRDRWIREIRAQLADATGTLLLLPRDARIAVRSALSLFACLADRLAKTPAADLYRVRVRISDARKAFLIARSALQTLREAS
jgi:phytoene/squalene synthetase